MLGIAGDPTRVYPGQPRDGYVVVFDPAGDLVFSTYHGGSGLDRLAWGLDVEEDGVVVVGGGASATDFPQANAPDSSHAGEVDSYLSKIVINNAPSITTIAPTSVREGSEYRYDLESTDDDAGDA